MERQLSTQAKALRLTPAQLASLQRRLHFGTQPVGAVAGWLPKVLNAWQYARPTATAVVHSPPNKVPATSRTITAARLDTSYSWFPASMASLSGRRLALAGADCRWLAPNAAATAGLNGSVALVTLTALPSTDPRAPCSYVRLMQGATAAGADALLLAGGRPLPMAGPGWRPCRPPTAPPPSRRGAMPLPRTSRRQPAWWILLRGRHWSRHWRQAAPLPLTSPPGRLDAPAGCGLVGGRLQGDEQVG